MNRHVDSPSQHLMRTAPVFRTTLLHQENLELSGRRVCRNAIRGIIQRDQQLLMVYSGQNGDYKFPGGGILADESPQQALIREIAEECGARVLSVGRLFAEVRELANAKDEDADLFDMTSAYYFCQVDPRFGQQHLDPYEAALRFRPLWVHIDQAIQINESVLQRCNPPAPRWTRRDTLILHELARLRHADEPK